MYCLYVYILFCKKKYDNGILLNSNLISIKNATVYKSIINSSSICKLNVPSGKTVVGVIGTAYDFSDGTGNYSYYVKLKDSTGIEVLDNFYYKQHLFIRMKNNSQNDYIEFITNDYISFVVYWIC